MGSFLGDLVAALYITIIIYIIQYNVVIHACKNSLDIAELVTIY